MLEFLPVKVDVESKAVLRKTAMANKALAELKGVTGTIPNEKILLETLALREARESSAIENIISTFDEVYQSNLFSNQYASPEAKEVHQYAKALIEGFNLVKKYGGKIIHVHKALPDWFQNYKFGLTDDILNMHISEVSWIRSDFDYDIDNTSTICDLYEKIQTIIEL